MLLEQESVTLVKVAEVFVPAVPVSQPAKDVRIVRTKDGREIAVAQTPEKHPVNAFKATAAMAARDVYDGPPLDGPLFVNVEFVFPRGGKPGWISRKETPLLFHLWKEGCRVPYAVKRKHDRDNLMKSLQDALTGILWADDGLIYGGRVDKVIASSDEQPHVWVEVMRHAD